VKRILELFARTLPLVFLVAHCATEADSGSQTHWLAACVQDADCGAGLVCRCARCMKECTDGSCTGLPRPAECAPRGSPALAAQCGSAGPACLAKCTESEGCSSDEKCVSGLCVNLWLGAPCEECNLPAQARRLAGAGAEDCGRLSADAGDAAISDGLDCVRAAFQAGRPFIWIRDLGPGTDSFGSSATVFDGRRIHGLTYDSNVCGGGAGCGALTCGPWITSTTCDPVISPDAGAGFECAMRPDTPYPDTVLCGPNPRCYGGVCL